MPLQITVDASEVIARLRRVEDNLNQAGYQTVRRAASQVESRIRPIIMRVYENAVASTGGDFPSIYAGHLRQGIQQLTVEVVPRGTSLLILIGDIEDLGDYGELVEASHYHAILNVAKGDFSVRNPQLAEIGTNVGDLYGPNKSNGEDRREAFFDAMKQGADFTVQFGGGNAPGWTAVVSTEGDYEEMLNARVQFWGNRYPEWIILDQGSPAGIEVEPTHFVAITRQAIEDMAETIIEQIAYVTFEEAVDDTPTPYTPSAVRFDPQVNRFRGPGGRFIKRPS